MLPWAWRNAKSKCIGSVIHVRPTPPWAWRTAKSKCLGNYFELDWLPRPNALGLVCVLDSRPLGLGTLPSLSALPTLLWIWLIAKSKYIGSGKRARLMPSWIWLIAKSKCIRSNRGVRPMPPWTWRTTKSKHLELGYLSSPSALIIIMDLNLTHYQVQAPYPRYLGFD